ncbi:MAG: sulfite exporter TauE/SafE family protein [Candidatus Paceibacterota bacterium]
MIELLNGQTALLSAFLMGLAINFDICPLAGDFAILSYIINEAKSFKKTFGHIIFYTLGRITAYTLLTIILFFGLSQIDISLFKEKGELIIGVALIFFGLINLTTKKHCCEHDSQKKLANKTLLGSFIWGLVFSLGFCPHSGAIFFGMFIPLTTSNFNLLLPIVFALGASSVIIFFSLLLSFNPDKAKKLLEKMEQRETTAKSLVAIIFILVGILYLIK